MGFFQKLFGFGDQMFQSDDEKIENVEKVADQVKKLLEHASVAHHGDDTVLVRGTFHGRRTTIEIDMTFGGFEIAMETGCAYPGERMSLAHDSDGPKRKIPGASQEPDSFGDTKVFLSKTVYLEGDPDEIEHEQELLRRLPAALLQKLVAHLEASEARASFEAHGIEIAPWKGNVAQRSAFDQIRGHLGVAADLAQATEIAWR